MSNDTSDSYTSSSSSSNFLFAVAAVFVSAVVALFLRQKSVSCIPKEPNHISSIPPTGHAAAAAAIKAKATKDIIRKIITPPMSPSSPAAESPAAAVMLSPRRRTAALSPPPPPAPRASSPKSSKKSSTRMDADQGVFKADFIVSEKKDRSDVLYLIRLSPALRPPYSSFYSHFCNLNIH
jgi:hypothetical protein